MYCVKRLSYHLKSLVLSSGFSDYAGDARSLKKIWKTQQKIKMKL